MKDETVLKAISIITISLLEGIALIKGVDGAMLAMVLTILAGIAGYSIGKKIQKS